MSFCRSNIIIFAIVLAGITPAGAQSSNSDSVPIGTMPLVNDLPVRKEMPDVMIMNDGTRVTRVEQWIRRRAEMKAILEHYELGHAPPPPGNVRGQDIQSRLVLNGACVSGWFTLVSRREKNWASTSPFSHRPMPGRFQQSSIRPSS